MDYIYHTGKNNRRFHVEPQLFQSDGTVSIWQRVLGTLVSRERIWGSGDAEQMEVTQAKPGKQADTRSHD